MAKAREGSADDEKPAQVGQAIGKVTPGDIAIAHCRLILYPYIHAHIAIYEAGMQAVIDKSVIDPAALDRAADEAAEMLKTLANPARLRLLCALLPGELCVSELEEALGASQSYVSGQLARMRAEGLVACDRDGRTIRYRLNDPRLGPVLERLYEVFCAPAQAATRSAP